MRATDLKLTRPNAETAERTPAGQTFAQPGLILDAWCSQPMVAVYDELRALRGAVPMPEVGHGWRTQPESWYRLVGQICAVGSSRSWEALQTASVKEDLAIGRIRAEGDTAAEYVHAILARTKVRYCSPHSRTSAKAKAIAENAFSTFVADANGQVCLLNRLSESVGQPGDQNLLTHDQARAARRLLVRNIRFFGPKSASDFLVGLGIADSLLAFDVRLLNLFIDVWGLDPSWRSRVHRLEEYETLEDRVVQTFCPALGVSPAELDRLLFYGYPSLKHGRQA